MRTRAALVVVLMSVAAAGLASGCSPVSGGPCAVGRHGRTTGQELDYIDFVKVAGTTYMAEPMFGYRTAGHARADRGVPVGKVRCELSILSVDPGNRMRDLDAAFLAPGTQVWGQLGVPVKCAVVAARGGHDVLYVAAATTPGKTEPLCSLRELQLPPTPAQDE